jgi:hypothetical protein
MGIPCLHPKYRRERLLLAPHTDQPWDIRIGSTCDQPATKKWPVTSAAMSLALDIFILVLPIPVVLRLHLNAKRRVGVFLIFFTAVLSVIALFLPLARLER